MDLHGILKTLVAHDTTSMRSNLALVEWIADVLDQAGCRVRLSRDPSKTKANLLAWLGPEYEGGALLSGHTDVVPVDGQVWSSDPFTLHERDGRLHGRGAVDMKSFVACCIAEFAARDRARLKRPLILALSYDEELGCLGMPGLIADFGAAGWPKPAFAVVGEPTSMRIATAHKGVFVGRVDIRGHAAHSSDPREGLNAIECATDVVAALRGLAERLKGHGSALPLDPPYTTLNIGTIGGGEALNTVPSASSVVFEFRPIPEADGGAIWDDIANIVTTLDARLKALIPDAGATLARLATVLPLREQPDNAAEHIVRTLMGSNAPSVIMPFGTDAGHFQAAGIPTIVCGPGSIAQAHKPDEWIAIDQLTAGRRFLSAVGAWAARTN
jgi:acetylornithine deacetylase